MRCDVITPIKCLSFIISFGAVFPRPVPNSCQQFCVCVWYMKQQCPRVKQDDKYKTKSENKQKNIRLVEAAGDEVITQLTMDVCAHKSFIFHRKKLVSRRGLWIE